jgi:hypothetical protein
MLHLVMGNFTLAKDLNLVTIYAACLSTAVFIWQVLVYLREGARLRLSASANMKMFEEGFQASELSKDTYIVLNATNVGTADTTVTHVLAFAYKNRLQKWRRKPEKSFIVKHVSATHPIPYVLEVGKMFMSLVRQGAEIEDLSRTKLLYLAIQHSFTDKPVMIRVKPIPALKPEKPTLE